MTTYLDSSVLVASILEDEPHHESCLRLLRGKNLVAWSHALTEVFATLTGGRLGIRISPRVATDLVESSLLPRLRLVDLQSGELMEALRATQVLGVRGGAIYDFLHLTVARRSAASVVYTLNSKHFTAITRQGDPEIILPSANRAPGIN